MFAAGGEEGAVGAERHHVAGVAGEDTDRAGPQSDPFRGFRTSGYLPIGGGLLSNTGPQVASTIVSLAAISVAVLRHL